MGVLMPRKIHGAPNGKTQSSPRRRTAAKAVEGPKDLVATTITARELSRNTASVLAAVHDYGRSAIVTSRGQIVAALVPVNEDDVLDWVLASAPEFVRSMRKADSDLTAGRTRSAADVFAKLDKEHQRLQA